jgi:peptidoglycan/LPS O-acetylase OafA/YrhL
VIRYRRTLVLLGISNHNLMSILEYRAYIDGLRAIAVISVLLFHFDKHLLPGGFVGVDVFFVISGYLIASIIINECENGQFSFSRFYQRRVSRIFPVFFLVSLLTLIAAYFLYASQDFTSAGAVTIAAALSVANLKFMLQGNYFQLSPDAQPLLHFWSLSVEEQFYFVFPLIVYLSFRLGMTRRKLLYVLIALAVISFIACIVLTKKNPTWAFYLLPTRAWELLAGCILAAYCPERKAENQRLAPIISNIGLLIIVISFFAIHEGLAFPGFVAAIPVLGTVLLIGCSQISQQTIAKKFLSHPFLILIGKMSYSLYLWHWPIYSFVDYSLYLQSPILRSILKVSLTILFSYASYLWFEQPARSYLNKSTKVSFTFTSFAIGIITFVAIGFFINTSNYINASPDTIKDGGITFNSNLSKPIVVLMGDSNGSMYGKTLKEIAQKMQIRTHIISVGGGDPFPDTQLYKDSLLFLDRTRPDITIFVTAWAEKVGNNRKRFTTALSQILQKSGHVIVITQPPNLPENASRQVIRESGQVPIFEDITSSNLRQDTNTFLLSHRNERIHILDVDSIFKKPNGEIRFSDSQGQQMYQDRHHISGYGSEMVKKLIAKEISQILTSSSPKMYGKSNVLQIDN